MERLDRGNFTAKGSACGTHAVTFIFRVFLRGGKGARSEGCVPIVVLRAGTGNELAGCFYAAEDFWARE